MGQLHQPLNGVLHPVGRVLVQAVIQRVVELGEPLLLRRSPESWIHEVDVVIDVDVAEEVVVCWSMKMGVRWR